MWVCCVKLSEKTADDRLIVVLGVYPAPRALRALQGQHGVGDTLLDGESGVCATVRFIQTDSIVI